MSVRTSQPFFIDFVVMVVLSFTFLRLRTVSWFLASINRHTAPNVISTGYVIPNRIVQSTAFLHSGCAQVLRFVFVPFLHHVFNVSLERCREICSKSTRLLVIPEGGRTAQKGGYVVSFITAWDTTISRSVGFSVSFIYTTTRLQLMK